MTDTLTSTSDAPASKPRATGPLAGIRIVEFAGLGPGPFASMMLADMGADVVTLMRGEQKQGLRGVIMMRGRRQIACDLKDKQCVADVLKLLEGADALIEGYRPGVMERLGFGPDVVLARNKRIVYARMTGWGQSGPLANAAGHDINYISVTGALAAIGAKDKPVPPLNLVGDYGGGALYLVVGILAALLEAQKSGQGQVVDVAMCDGAASLMSLFCELTAIGRWKDGRESQTCWMAARISTAPMNARTASSSRWVRSSRNSTPNCAGSPASMTRSMRARWTPSNGRR